MLTKPLGALVALFTAILLSVPAHAEDRQYEVGQIWAYKVENAGDGGALIIQRIERAEDAGWPRDIYHISLFIDVQLGEMDELEVGHLPVSRETLDSALTELTDRDMMVFADWESGYREWQRANGGVFTIGLDEIVDMLTGMMVQQTQHTGGH